jgi:hypothetical protein
MSAHPLYAPRPVEVDAGTDGVPASVAGLGVEAVREHWLLRDRWWTQAPLDREYFELVLADGRDTVVFRSAGDGRWFLQRA